MMLIRAKKTENAKVKGCLCLEEKKCGPTEWAVCENKDCTSKRWHKECVGLRNLNDKELKKIRFICPLCLLSCPKFKDSYMMANNIHEQLEEFKMISLDLKKQVINMKELELEKITSEVEKQLEEVKNIKQQLYESSENDKKEQEIFYEKVTKQLNDFNKEVKNDFKIEAENGKSYRAALLNNMKNLETNQEQVVQNVVKEVVKETQFSSHDRSKREKNVIIFKRKECENEDEEATQDENFLKEMFTYIDHAVISFNSMRLGKRAPNKCRPIKISFNELGEKRKFLSLLYKLAKAPDKFKAISVQHDLSETERDYLTELLAKAKEKNNSEKPVDYLYKVRGHQGAFEIWKIPNRSKK